VGVELSCHKALRELALLIGEPGHVVLIVVVGNGTARTGVGKALVRQPLEQLVALLFDDRQRFRIAAQEVKRGREPGAEPLPRHRFAQILDQAPRQCLQSHRSLAE